jgi:hypothetical protein
LVAVDSGFSDADFIFAGYELFGAKIVEVYKAF